MDFLASGIGRHKCLLFISHQLMLIWLKQPEQTRTPPAKPFIRRWVIGGASRPSFENIVKEEIVCLKWPLRPQRCISSCRSRPCLLSISDYHPGQKASCWKHLRLLPGAASGSENMCLLSTGRLAGLGSQHPRAALSQLQAGAGGPRHRLPRLSSGTKLRPIPPTTVCRSSGHPCAKWLGSIPAVGLPFPALPSTPLPVPPGLLPLN